MFVRRWKYERLQGELEGARLLIEHLERLVDYERNRSHPTTPEPVAEVSPPQAPEVLELPPEVEAAVAASATPGTDAHLSQARVAHNLLQSGKDAVEVARMVTEGDRSFDRLLRTA